MNGSIFPSRPMKIEVMTAVGGTLIEARCVQTSKVCEHPERWRVKCTYFFAERTQDLLNFCPLGVFAPPPPVTAMCVSNLLVCLLIFLEYVEARPYGRRFVDANNMKPLNQEGNPIDSSGRHARLHV